MNCYRMTAPVSRERMERAVETAKAQYAAAKAKRERRNARRLVLSATNPPIAAPRPRPEGSWDMSRPSRQVECRSVDAKLRTPRSASAAAARMRKRTAS